MKTILTLIFVIVFGAYAVAQDVKTDSKVHTSTIDVVLPFSEAKTPMFTEVKVEETNSIVRILLFKMDKLKKELAFMTKEDKPILV